MPGEPREQPRKETHETGEIREERERVLVALHAYFQEELQNTPLHAELAAAIQRAEELTQEALPYLEEYARSGMIRQQYHDVEIHMGLDILEIFLKATDDKTNKRELWKGGDRIPDILRRDFFKKQQKEQKFQELIGKTENAFTRLAGLRQEIEEHRGRIFKEALVALGLGSLLTEGELTQSPDGLYASKGYAWMRFQEVKTLSTTTQKAETQFIGRDHIHWLAEDKMQQLGITKEQIMNLQKIEWSAEDQKKLRRLEAGVADYKKNVAAVQPAIAVGRRLSKASHKLLLDIDVEGFARYGYYELKLPLQHCERVVQELKSYGKIMLS